MKGTTNQVSTSVSQNWIRSASLALRTSNVAAAYVFKSVRALFARASAVLDSIAVRLGSYAKRQILRMVHRPDKPACQRAVIVAVSQPHKARKSHAKVKMRLVLASAFNNAKPKRVGRLVMQLHHPMRSVTGSTITVMDL